MPTAGIGNGQIQDAVSIEIAACQSMCAAGGISLEELECAVTLPKENLHLAAYELGNGQVELAISVEICRNNINVPYSGGAKVSPLAKETEGIGA